MSLGTVSITSSLLRGIAEGVDEVADPSYIITITTIFNIINVFHDRQYMHCNIIVIFSYH